MCKLRSIFCVFLFCSAVALVSARGSSNRTSKWKTLRGFPPTVIADGGFSGLFADSSFNAYTFAAQTSLPNVVMWCNVQLTKDEQGICFPNIRLSNASNVESVLTGTKNSNLVKGVQNQDWYCKDFNLKDLENVSLTQGVYSRSNRFDGTQQPILTVNDVFTQSVVPYKPAGFWLNFQHDSFYRKYNLSMRRFLLSASRTVVINYISSPEVSFLTSIATQFNKRATKLVFRFLGKDETEPSTNQTYGSLLNNLTFIKTFASAILVPKNYILPVDKLLYLQPYTSIVPDAHALGLEVYASDFASDSLLPYDYDYDPLAEYLSFIDNSNFSVDGVVSPFPITPSAAIGCYSHMNKNEKNQVGLEVISFCGASGSYPGCTDIAYSSAVSDGADIIDCPIQMTKDNIPFCSGSVNLISTTTAAQVFLNLSSSIPELNTANAIHSFNLTWSDITQRLKPSISNPFLDFQLQRNPKARNQGNFMTLSDFLGFARNTSSLSGILISIENEAYLRKLGFSVTESVLQALNKSGFDNDKNNHTTPSPKVMIMSNDSAVLKNMTNKKFELVYRLNEDVRGIENSSVSDIKTFAGSVVISKKSVFPTDEQFLMGQTDVVAKLKEAGLKVYVQVFNNEFVSQAWDFFSDPYVELNSYVFSEPTGPVDGVITGFPATADRYRRSPCLTYKELPSYMFPVQPGSLLRLIAPPLLPPAEAPSPVLTESDVVQPPLPPVSDVAPPPLLPPGSNTSAPSPKASHSGQPLMKCGVSVISLCILVLVLVLMGVC